MGYEVWWLQLHRGMGGSGGVFVVSRGRGYSLVRLDLSMHGTYMTAYDVLQGST